MQTRYRIPAARSRLNLQLCASQNAQRIMRRRVASASMRVRAAAKLNTESESKASDDWRLTAKRKLVNYQTKIPTLTLQSSFVPSVCRVSCERSRSRRSGQAQAVAAGARACSCSLYIWYSYQLISSQKNPALAVVTIVTAYNSIIITIFMSNCVWSETVNVKSELVCILLMVRNVYYVRVYDVYVCLIRTAYVSFCEKTAWNFSTPIFSETKSPMKIASGMGIQEGSRRF